MFRTLAASLVAVGADLELSSSCIIHCTGRSSVGWTSLVWRDTYLEEQTRMPASYSSRPKLVLPFHAS
jgi:hypothetical protein